MIDFNRVLEYMDGVVVITPNIDAMRQLDSLLHLLPEVGGEERIAVLKALEVWSYRHPKELSQIKQQVEWKVSKNA